MDDKKRVYEYIKSGSVGKIDLIDSMLKNAKLANADLKEADFEHANLSGADLSGADLSGVNLRGARLKRTNLSKSNLIRANLNWANLIKANLSGANLSNAKLSGVDLTSTILTNANLSGALLMESKILRSDAAQSGAELFNTRLIDHKPTLVRFQELFKKIISFIKPNAADYYDDAFDKFMHLDFLGALATLSKVIKINPKFVKAFVLRGDIRLTYFHDFQGAISDYSKAVELDSSLADYYKDKIKRIKLESQGKLDNEPF